MELPTLEEQVCTIEQAQELQSYGVPEGALCSVADPDGKRHIVLNDEFAYEMSHMNPCPVWTLSELMHILPNGIIVVKTARGWQHGEVSSGRVSMAVMVREAPVQSAAAYLILILKKQKEDTRIEL